MTDKEQRQKAFAEYWKNKGYEKGQSQTFWLPLQQAKKYIAELPLSRYPKYVITCNFKSFLIYNMENPNGEPEEIL